MDKENNNQACDRVTDHDEKSTKPAYFYIMDLITGICAIIWLILEPVIMPDMWSKMDVYWVTILHIVLITGSVILILDSTICLVKKGIQEHDK